MKKLMLIALLSSTASNLYGAARPELEAALSTDASNPAFIPEQSVPSQSLLSSAADPEIKIEGSSSQERKQTLYSDTRRCRPACLYSSSAASSSRAFTGYGKQDRILFYKVGKIAKPDSSKDSSWAWISGQIAPRVLLIGERGPGTYAEEQVENIVSALQEAKKTGQMPGRINSILHRAYLDADKIDDTQLSAWIGTALVAVGSQWPYKLDETNYQRLTKPRLSMQGFPAEAFKELP